MNGHREVNKKRIRRVNKVSTNILIIKTFRISREIIEIRMAIYISHILTTKKEEMALAHPRQKLIHTWELTTLSTARP